AEGTVGQVRRDVDHGGRELIREIARREPCTLRAARGSHDGDTLGASALLQPLCPRTKALEWNLTQGRREILVVEDALCERRMAVACEQGGLSLGQSASGAGQNHHWHARSHSGSRREEPAAYAA